MDLKEIIDDKLLKPKVKTELLSQHLLEAKDGIDQIIILASSAKDPVRATCIEAIEFATKIKPEIAGSSCLDFVTANLAAKAPRVKWESAKVIGNIAHLFPDRLALPVEKLLVNSENPGTVVRWSAAYALGEIIKLNTSLNTELLPAARAIIEREEKNSIKKIYLEAFRKLTKDLKK